jgi:two-component system sensor histidine kinase SenX3
VVISRSIQEAIATTSFLAKKKHITILSHVKSYKVLGNNDELINLFVILLDNAVKYSPEKTQITLSSKTIGRTIYIMIKDQGIGIDQKDTEKIFERFYRTDMSRQRSDIGGYGLGLSIAKQIVSQHKGSISVTSTVKKGSVFTIQFPAFTS